MSSKKHDGFEGYFWFFKSQQVARKEIAWQKSKNLIDPEQKLYAMSLIGHYPNHDMWLGNSLKDN